MRDKCWVSACPNVNGNSLAGQFAAACNHVSEVGSWRLLRSNNKGIGKVQTMNSELALAIQQIQFARNYTLSLLDEIDPADWFRQPAEGVTHVAWQTGHLAMAQYGLCLFRIRGRQDVDRQLMSSVFRKKFSKSTTPTPDAAAYPSVEEIRNVFDAVYSQVMKELPLIDDSVLQEPIDEPWAVSPTKLGGLVFCACHEMMHAGQIGLLRRLLGYPTIR
jgi:DinB superfamily